MMTRAKRSFCAGAPQAVLFSVLLVMPPTEAKSDTAVAHQVHRITIDKMVFGPAPTSVRPGDVILWVNKDMFKHTATARDRSFDVELPSGAEARTVVRQAGTFKFYCRYHPGMTGVLTVSKQDGPEGN